MQKEILVLYHGNCDDGFGSYLSAYLHFGDKADYVAAHHNESFFKKIKYKNYQHIYLLDISFPIDIMQFLLNKNKKITVIDHHQSALAIVPAFRENKQIQINLDMSRSGAMMSWQYFHPEKAVPLLIKLIEDVDLWRFTHQESKFFNKALRSYPRHLDFWQDLLKNDTKVLELVADGYTIDRYFNHQLLEISNHAIEITLNNIPGLMVNANHSFVSEIGNYLAKKCGTFALVWRHECDGIACSLRSMPGIDVAHLAEKYGGGGHAKKTAFCLRDLNELFKLITDEKTAHQANQNLSFSKPN